MKAALIIPFLTVISFLSQASGPGYPKIFLEYADSLDIKLCQPTGISPAVVQEAMQKLPIFQKLWNDDSTNLLATTISGIGKPFLRSEETVNLFLCPRLPSMGTPLLITYYPFLDSTTSSHPLSPLYFKGIVFHELLHKYVNSILTTQTPLLKKYSNEPALVKVHLHVDAVQKLVYLKLGRQRDLQTIVASDSKNFGEDYRRAWEIVNTVEGYEGFVKELQMSTR